MDVEDIRPGQNFVRAIDETVAGCLYLLMLIGPRWLEMMEQHASATDDFVRREIHVGLSRGITVIPVLVAGARMPEEQQLPSDLAELSRRNAIEIRDDRFDDDVAKLIECLNIPSSKIAVNLRCSHAVVSLLAQLHSCWLRLPGSRLVR